MGDATTWLAGKVASLVPGALPNVAAQAVISCPPGFFPVQAFCSGTNCLPATHLQFQFTVCESSSGSAFAWQNPGCCNGIPT